MEGTIMAHSRIQLDDMRRALNELADRLLKDEQKVGLDPCVGSTLKLVMGELKRYVPGLELPTNADIACAFAASAEMALRDDNNHDALSFALRGLAGAPHNPRLWHLAASASVNCGAIELAIQMLDHSLWIHPGFGAARQDYQALTSFFHGHD